MRTYRDEALIKAAQQLSPVIQAHREEAERERRLSRPVVSALGNAGLLSMFTPQSLGGLETNPVTTAHVIEEVSKPDTAAGWALVNPLSYAYFCARLPNEGAEELFKTQAQSLISGPSFHPPMQATPVDGGYRVTGRSRFASSCHDAVWIAVTAIAMPTQPPQTGPGGAPEVIMAYFPKTECDIIDTWHVMGMKGTGSDDIAMANVFVPRSRTLMLTPEFVPGLHYEGPLYRFPYMGIVATLIPPVMLASARRAIEEVMLLAQGKVPFASTSLLRDRTSAQAALARAEGLLRATRLLLYETISEAWESTLAGKTLTLQQKADLLLAATQAVNSSAQVVEWMYNAAGTSSFYTQSPLERLFRDTQVLKQHGFTSEQRFETVGRVYLGLAPDFSLVPY